MAINKFMRATLKALSYPDLNIKENYELVRKVINVIKPVPSNPTYNSFDYQISNNGYEIPVRIFKPNDIEGRFPVLIFFHGGGWVTGNIDSYTKVCANMASITNHVVISVDYRLAPEYRFPIPAEDCYKVAEELFNHSEMLNVCQEQITLIGDSAGGNLAAAVSLMARDRGVFLPKRQILIYPSTYNCHNENSPFPSVMENGNDYLLTSKRIQDYLDMYISDESDLLNPYFAPLLSENLSNQPDTLIITAEFDPLRDEGEAYGEALQRAGNNVQLCRMSDALHGFFSLPPKFTDVRKSYELITNFINQPISEK